jgi:hypothetical protein
VPTEYTSYTSPNGSYISIVKYAGRVKVTVNGVTINMPLKRFVDLAQACWEV